MKKLLPILTFCLFCLNCEQGWIKDILVPPVEGCTDSNSCNYNSDAEEDDGSCIAKQGCNGWCEGDSFEVASLDNCDTCDADVSNDCTQDCHGIWGGIAVVEDPFGDCCVSIPEGWCDCVVTRRPDVCGDCEGEIQDIQLCPPCDDGSIRDCAGVCGGDAVDSDGDGICDSDETNPIDCAGVVGGTAVEDCAGVCGGTAVLSGCDNVCNSTAVVDCAGECGGDAVCSVYDIDGNVYETVMIGNQIWTVENLKTTKYKDGSEIPTGYSGSDWSNLTTGAYAVYADDPANADIYGNLYNWYAIENQQLCMEGWHVPTDDEFATLVSLGGGKLKDTGTIEDADGLWYAPNEGATNESGFTALPGSSYPTMLELGERGYFYSSTESGGSDNSKAWSRAMTYYNAGTSWHSVNKYYGLSVRCLKGAVDCSGVVGGTAVEDCAGVCGGTAVLSGCDNVCNSTAVEDCAGVCGGTTDCSVYDINGNGYTTVTIGTQEWLVQNLKATKYKDGSAIPNITNNGDWSGLSTGAYGDYDNNPTNSETYGRLYNWYAVETQQLCMEGWHVPTDEEWTVLTDYLGGSDNAGGKMKEAGTEHWNSPNIGATNESGFTGLPGGHRSETGSSLQMGTSCHFWSSSESGSYNAWYRRLRNLDSKMAKYSHGLKLTGFGIRCLKD